VCVNHPPTADGAPPPGVDEELYEHAREWRTWSGYSDQERVAAEFGLPVSAAEHTVLRDDRGFLDPRQRTLFPRSCFADPGAVLRAMDRHGTGF